MWTVETFETVSVIKQTCIDLKDAPPEVGHVPEGQAAHHGVGVLAVLLHRVDNQQRQLRVQAGIGAQEHVHQLLLDHVHRGARLHHLTEQARHIHALGHHPDREDREREVDNVDRLTLNRM